MKPNLTTSMLLSALRWVARLKYWARERREDAGAILPGSLLAIRRWTRAAWVLWRMRTNHERWGAERPPVLASAAPLAAVAMDLPQEPLEIALRFMSAAVPVAGALICIAALACAALLLGCLIDAAREGRARRQVLWFKPVPRWQSKTVTRTRRRPAQHVEGRRL